MPCSSNLPGPETLKEDPLDTEVAKLGHYRNNIIVDPLRGKKSTPSFIPTFIKTEAEVRFAYKGKILKAPVWRAEYHRYWLAVRSMMTLAGIAEPGDFYSDSMKRSDLNVLTQMIKDWSRESCKGRIEIEIYSMSSAPQMTVLFENARDLTFFQLTWGVL